MSDQNKRKRKKNYYICSNKKVKRNALQPGMKGILITCNSSENRCVREAYNLLNEYADKIFGPVQASAEDDEITDDDDVEKQIQKELESLKERKDVYRFQSVNTKVKNCLFIQSRIPDPELLVHSLFEDIKATQERKSRFIQRMIPVMETCKAFLENVKKGLLALISNYLPDSANEKATYMMIYKVRNNQQLQKNDVLNALKDVVQEIRPSWIANIVDPELIINVNIMQSVCCLSILRDFDKFRKYNLSEVSTFKSVKLSEQKIVVKAKGINPSMMDKNSDSQISDNVSQSKLTTESNDICSSNSEPLLQIFSNSSIAVTRVSEDLESDQIPTSFTDVSVLPKDQISLESGNSMSKTVEKDCFTDKNLDSLPLAKTTCEVPSTAVVVGEES